MEFDLFDTPGVPDSGIPTSDFDFYFLQSHPDVLSVGVPVLAAEQQHQPQQQNSRRHEDDLAYLEARTAATSMNTIVPRYYPPTAATTTTTTTTTPPPSQRPLPSVILSSSVPMQGENQLLPKRAGSSQSLTAVASSGSALTALSSDASPASGTGSTSTSSTSTSVPVSASAMSASRAKRLERRGHTKSRNGCYNCKRRRIKCQETKPACGHCTKTGLQCEYPIIPLVNHQPQHQIPLFSLQDMRFFQHFLENCCPHQPIGNNSVWTHEIPCLSHNYDYLMHAILGLAASDLMQQDPSLVTAAMDHRLKAIRAIKRTLAAVSRRPPPPFEAMHPSAFDASSTDGAADGLSIMERDLTTDSPMFAEGNALLATCFALTFQSVSLDDGMAEYMTFIRGILVVAVQMYLRGARLLFRNLTNNTEMVQRKLREDEQADAGSHAVDIAWCEGAVSAVRQLAPLCEGDPLAMAYHTLLLEAAEALFVSPSEAYGAIGRHYGWWIQLPQEQFRQVVDLDQPIFVLLASHWIALKQIMGRITSVELQVDDKEAHPKASTSPSGTPTTDGSMDPGIVRWLKHLNRQVMPEFAKYNEWPMWVEAELDRDLSAFGRSS